MVDQKYIEYSSRMRCKINCDVRENLNFPKNLYLVASVSDIRPLTIAGHRFTVARLLESNGVLKLKITSVK